MDCSAYHFHAGAQCPPDYTPPPWANTTTKWLCLETQRRSGSAHYNTYHSLAKSCTARFRLLWERYQTIAERSWVLFPQLVDPSGSMPSKAMAQRLKSLRPLIRAHRSHGGAPRFVLTDVLMAAPFCSWGMRCLTICMSSPIEYSASGLISCTCRHFNCQEHILEQYKPELEHGHMWTFAEEGAPEGRQREKRGRHATTGRAWPSPSQTPAIAPDRHLHPWGSLNPVPGPCGGL